MPGIDEAKLKIGWAKKHLDALDAELRSFCTPANAYTLIREDEVENQRHILRLHLVDVPPEICLIVGDAFYNMRSALDQLVWSLARLNGIPGRTQFPIVEMPTVDSLKRFEKQIIGAPPEAFCEIKALQPYHRGAAYKNHPLWRLDEMCNLDKHRRIPANGSILNTYFPLVTAGDHRSGTFRIDPTDDGFVVSIPLSMKHKLEFKPTRPITVSFGGDASGIAETREGIAEIYDFVSLKVIPRFERFFV